MHRTRILVLTALVLAPILATAACGGGSSGGKAAPGGAAAAGDASMNPGASGGSQSASIPQITVTEKGGGGNDGPTATLPHGLVGDKATAAGLGSDGTTVISVTNTDTSCIPDKTSVPAGKVWIKVTNNGAKITEMYLETSDGDELVEVEKITPGGFGAFKTTAKAGNYLIACEPGMSDTQIRTPLTVTP